MGQGNPLWGSYLLVGGPRVDSDRQCPSSLTRGYRNAAPSGLAGYATGGQPWGTVRLRLVAVFGRRLVGRGLGFGGFFGEAALPCPGVAHGGVDGHFGFPAKHGVGFSGLGPDLLDVAFAACADVVGHFYAGGTFEVVDQFKHGEAAACAEVEDLDGVGAGIVEHALHGRDKSLGEVDNVDVVADA